MRSSIIKSFGLLFNLKGELSFAGSSGFKYFGLASVRVEVFLAFFLLTFFFLGSSQSKGSRESILPKWQSPSISYGPFLLSYCVKSVDLSARVTDLTVFSSSIFFSILLYIISIDYLVLYIW